MKIYSKSKDYYDMVGVSDTSEVKFFRTYRHESVLGDFSNIQFVSQVVLPAKMNEKNKFVGGRRFNRLYFVGFCGEIIPLLCLNVFEKECDFIYNSKEILKYLNDNSNGGTTYPHINDLSNYINEFTKLVKNKDYFSKFKTPTFLIDHNADIHINPVLKNIKFQKIKTHYEVYNEIEIFISERLGDKMEIFELTDKDKIVSKGFDYKTSFRKV